MLFFFRYRPFSAILSFAVLLPPRPQSFNFPFRCSIFFCYPTDVGIWGSPELLSFNMPIFHLPSRCFFAVFDYRNFLSFRDFGSTIPLRAEVFLSNSRILELPAPSLFDFPGTAYWRPLLHLSSGRGPGDVPPRLSFLMLIFFAQSSRDKFRGCLALLACQAIG